MNTRKPLSIACIGTLRNLPFLILLGQKSEDLKDKKPSEEIHYSYMRGKNLLNEYNYVFYDGKKYDPLKFTKILLLCPQSTCELRELISSNETKAAINRYDKTVIIALKLPFAENLDLDVAKRASIITTENLSQLGNLHFFYWHIIQKRIREEYSSFKEVCYERLKYVDSKNIPNKIFQFVGGDDWHRVLPARPAISAARIHKPVTQILSIRSMLAIGAISIIGAIVIIGVFSESENKIVETPGITRGLGRFRH